MQINWFTVIAQVINFLILVWLLKRFLYKPVLQAIDEREQKITAQLNDAAAKKTEAQKEQDDFRKKNEDFDHQKNDLTAKAIADANTQRDQLIDAAKNDANTLRATLEKSAKDQQENQARAIAQKTQQQVLTIARKALDGLASQSLEAQSVTIFIQRLKASNKEERQQFMDAFHSNANTILVQSAFELPPAQQAELTDAVNEILNAKTALQFKTTPALISGIELTTNGYKLAWNMSEYLRSLEKSILEPAPEKPVPAS